MVVTKKNILNEDVISKKIERLALEIIENNLDEKEIFLVGIASNGVILARKIKKLIEANCSTKAFLITLQIDKKKPGDVILDSHPDFDGKVVIVVDDVTNSGRTLLYAMRPFLNYQPKKIQTAVLVERSHTVFPISADYKGFSLSTTLQEHITVEVKGDRVTGAYLE
jgi:pyrimidine operon attenuation protein/uracil phosphoribosyltransferase